MKIGKREKKFLARFFALFFILYALIMLVDLSPLNNFIAGVQSQALALAGFANTQSGSVIILAQSSFEVVAECTGLVMIAMLAALLYATQTKRSAYYFLVFAPVLFLFNLLRLFATFWVGAAWGSQAMEIIHVLLWFVDSAVVFFLWAVAAKIDLNRLFASLRSQNLD